MKLPATTKVPRQRWENIASFIAIFYFIAGIIFAFSFALYYHWPFNAYLSPGFFNVLFFWPLQFPGLLTDFLNYGLAGKPLGF
jgi:hypothetical protein